MDRYNKFLWMQDLLEHLQRCYEQWEGSQEGASTPWGAVMQRDLDELRRVCIALEGETRVKVGAAA